MKLVYEDEPRYTNISPGDLSRVCTGASLSPPFLSTCSKKM